MERGDRKRAAEGDPAGTGEGNGAPDPATPDPQILRDLLATRMPFGMHAGRTIAQLPTAYLTWFARTGFPKGRLGMLLSTMHEIRQNGLDGLLAPLRGGQDRPF